MVQSLPRPRGFSLIEALVALALIGFASSTLLLATTSCIQSGNDATAQTIARGIADQLADEILGQLYCEPATSPTSGLGPEAGEAFTGRRMNFDDSDDYSGYVASPRDVWGIALGQENGSGAMRPVDFRIRDDYFAGWTVRIALTYVDPDDPTKDLTGPATSVARAVRIQVLRDFSGVTQELASIRRVMAYVPPL